LRGAGGIAFRGIRTGPFGVRLNARMGDAGIVARRSEMDLGWQELLIILVVVMIVFGAGKLPEVARSLGQGVKAFKQEAEGPAGILGTGPTASTTVGPAAASGAPVERQVRADDI
jgi:sec-independent protein translocase protein TatA